MIDKFQMFVEIDLQGTEIQMKILFSKPNMMFV